MRSDRSRSPINRADAGHRVLVAHSVRQQTLANFPGEHRHVFRLVADDGVDDFAGGHLRFAASDHTWFDRTCVVVSAVASPT